MLLPKSPSFTPRRALLYFSNIFAIFISACSSGFPDGSICRQDTDCQSELCRSNLCLGSKCGKSAPRLSSGGCEEGWSCESFTSSTLVFFESSSQRCVALCPVCPEHFLCRFGDKYCSPDQDWPLPTVTATASATKVVTGSAVDFHASAVTPVGDMEFTYTWSFRGETTTEASGPDVTQTFNQQGSISVSVKAVSADGTLSGQSGVGVEVCSAPGAVCRNRFYCCSQECDYSETASGYVCR